MAVLAVGVGDAIVEIVGDEAFGGVDGGGSQAIEEFLVFAVIHQAHQMFDAVFAAEHDGHEASGVVIRSGDEGVRMTGFGFIENVVVGDVGLEDGNIVLIDGGSRAFGVGFNEGDAMTFLEGKFDDVLSDGTSSDNDGVHGGSLQNCGGSCLSIQLTWGGVNLHLWKDFPVWVGSG